MPNPKEKETQNFHLGNEKLRILVVDDEENIREILKDTLTMAGHHTTLSSNGEEALKLFYDQEFDLVITDLGMPGISGWEVNRRIKQTHPEKPVVIISGWGAQLSEEEIKASKVDLVLAKPFNLDQIIEVTKMFGNKTTSKQEAKRVSI
jgi:CheY-like chemotaxis protein